MDVNGEMRIGVVGIAGSLNTICCKRERNICVCIHIICIYNLLCIFFS